nr:hypothetical protein [uncultured Lichenicoccus sp.]
MSVVPMMRFPTPEEAVLNTRTEAVKTVSQVLRYGSSNLDSLPWAILRAIKLRAWEEFETPLQTVYRNSSMAEWIVSRPPQGLGSTIEQVRQLLNATGRAEEALLAFDREMQRPHGGAYNLTGRNQHSGDSGGVLDDNNVIIEQKRVSPVGNSAQAGIRRLRKAAEAGDEHAADLLAQVIDHTSEMSVHRACKEMGWRKDQPPLRALQAVWRRASQDEREEIAAWIDEQMSPLRTSRFG